MSDLSLRKLAHLREQLNEERFAVLVDSSNTGKVREFCDQLLRVPGEITIAGRTYKILDFLRGSKELVPGSTMVERAKEMSAYLGEDNGQHFLDHGEEIPTALQGKVIFVFPGWRAPGDPEYVACVAHDGNHGNHWVLFWYWLVDGFGDDARLLKREPDSQGEA